MTLGGKPSPAQKVAFRQNHIYGVFRTYTNPVKLWKKEKQSSP